MVTPGDIESQARTIYQAICVHGMGDETPASLREWAKALQSGKYKQGYRALKRRHGDGPEDFYYCCLGVKGILNSVPFEVHPNVDHVFCVLGDHAILPSSELPEFVQGYFTDMNDIYRFSFDDIAQVLLLVADKCEADEY